MKLGNAEAPLTGMPLNPLRYSSCALAPPETDPFYPIRSAGFNDPLYLVLIVLIFIWLILVQIRKIRNTWMNRLNSIQEERARIAKDLHDDVGAALTGLALQVDLAKNLADPSQRQLRSTLDHLGTDARGIADKIREIIWAVNPDCDHLESLVGRIVQTAEMMLESAGVPCRLVVPEQMPSIPVRAELRHCLLMIVKESITNALKHANPTEVMVEVTFIEQWLRVIIRDNGAGFDSLRPRTDHSSSGMGVHNLRRRIDQLGGKIHLESTPRLGTQVTADVPLIIPANMAGDYALLLATIGTGTAVVTGLPQARTEDFGNFPIILPPQPASENSDRIQPQSKAS